MEDCYSNSDCGKYNHCDIEEETCIHDDIFPVKVIDVFGYLIIGFLLGLQNVGGLGAGTVKIFILMMMLNYSMTQSTAYTFPCLLASKIADNIMLFMRKHPEFKEKPVIDFNIVMIFLPSVLFGGAVGATFNPILPSFSLSIIIILFITAAFVLTVKKVIVFMKIRKQQKLQQNQQQECQQEQEQQEQELVKIQQTKENLNEKNSSGVVNYQDDEVKNKEPKQNPTDFGDNQNIGKNNHNTETSEEKQLQYQTGNENKTAQQLLEKQFQQEKKIPYKKIGVICIIFALLFVFYGFLGSKKSDSFVGIDFCGTGYWVMFGMQFIIYPMFFIIIFKILQQEDNIKDNANYQLKKFEISYTKQGLGKVIIKGLACGLIDGLVGFGGPLMVIPTMVNLGLHPRSATASCSFLTIFSSGITVIIAILGGQIKTDALIFLFIVCFIGSFLFTLGLNKLVDYYKLDSLTIVFTSIVQFSLLCSSTGIFINNLVNEDFSTLVSVSSYC